MLNGKKMGSTRGKKRDESDREVRDSAGRGKETRSEAIHVHRETRQLTFFEMRTLNINSI